MMSCRVRPLRHSHGGASRSTGPPWSTPTATTCANGGQSSPQSPSSSSCGRSASSATRAAPTSVRYINKGRLDGDRPHLSPRRAARILLTRPDRLTSGQAQTLARTEAACPEMTALASLIRDFAALLVPDPGNATRLQAWITAARAADLPHAHAFTRGLDLDIQAATAALTMPFHNGRTEGVNTKTKMIKRQMYGRAGFTLLRHRILLG